MTVQTKVLTVDVGSRGAIAVMTEDGALISVEDMPCLNDGPAGRRAVNGPLLAEFIAKSHATKAFVELVGARPGEVAVAPSHLADLRALSLIEGSIKQEAHNG